MDTSPDSVEAALDSLQPRESASHDFRVRPFRSWVADLPLVNIAETGRRIHGALREMNRTRLPAADRTELLASLEPAVSHVIEGLRRHFVGRPIPLPDKGRKAAQLAMELSRLMAFGFELAGREAARGRERKLLGQCAHGALEHLGRALLTAYQVYQPHPPALWRSLHRVYGFAETHGAVSEPVGRPGRCAADTTASPAGAYKRSLLLALACPYRMRQGEVQTVYAALADWAPLATLEPLGDPIDQQGLFVVHLDSDEPPRYRSLDRVACSPASCRVLDAAPLGERLREALAAAEDDSAEAPMTGGRPSAGLLRRLVLNWGVMPRRGFARSPHDAEAELVVGLSAVHQRLRRDELGETTTPAGPAKEGPAPGIEAVIAGRAHFDASVRPEGGVPDVWDLAYDVTPATGSPRMVVLEEEPRSTQPEEPEYPVHRCRVGNISPGGYCIVCEDAGDGLQLQVGELLGIREPGAGRWEIAVVRWAKCLGPGKVELGAQVIAPHAEPAYVRRPEDGAPWVPALRLPEVRSVQQPAGLVVPPFALRRSSSAELREHAGTARSVTLTRLVENTGCFAQYHYARGGSPDEGGGSPGDEELDALWGAL